jgi:hypothetical protein
MKIKTNRFALKITLLILIFNTQFSELRAQNQPPDSIVIERIQFIQHTLDRDLVKTRQWWYGWLAGYSAATVAQGAVFLGSSDKSTRQDMALGAATTFLGVAGQFISPFIPRKLHKIPHLMSGNSTSDRLNKLAIGEELLRESAEREQMSRTWKSHILCTTVDLSSGLVTWLVFDRSIWAGIGNFAFNAAISEAQIWTQPILAQRNYKKYQQKYIKGDVELSYKPQVNWYLGAYAGGVGIKVVF